MEIWHIITFCHRIIRLKIKICNAKATWSNIIRIYGINSLSVSVCGFVCVKATGCIKRGKMLYAGAESERVRETENLGAGATAPLVLALTVRVLWCIAVCSWGSILRSVYIYIYILSSRFRALAIYLSSYLSFSAPPPLHAEIYSV